MRYSIITSVLVVGAALAASCGGSKSPAEDPYLPPESQEPERSAVGEAPECVDKDDKPVRCEEDSECCSGFVCGKDPELNPREKYCIYAGN